MGSGESPKVGVFVCHCGHNIAGTVNVEHVAELASEFPNVELSTHFMFMCSDSGQALIREKIEELGLNRVVVASCSPRMHEPTFRKVVEEAGLNRYCFEQVNLREHVSWCHMKEPEAATQKARDLVRMSVARASLLEPLEVKTVSVEPHALVVGGGVSGLRAALDIGDRGFRATLVERTGNLGGNLAKLSTLYPNNEPAKDVVDRMSLAAEASENVTILLNSEVTNFDGHIGNFEVTVKNNVTEEESEMKVGTVIVATGFDPFEPIGYYGYGDSPDIITLSALEEMKRDGTVLRPSTAQPPKNVAFISCVGSREEGVKGHEHCSRYCCTAMAKVAAELREEADEVLMLYDDIRTFGKGHEDVHRRARQEHVIFSKYNKKKKPAVKINDSGIMLKWNDVLSGENCEFRPDMLVLANAMVPPEGADEVAKIFSLTRSADGFFNEEHIKLAPLTTHTAGIMIAGAAQSAKSATDSTTQASGAAAKAVSLIARGEVEIESTVASVIDELCSACHTCVTACPYGATSIEATKGVEVARVTEAKCHGCGTCAAGCPSGAIVMRHSTDDQISSMIAALLSSAFVHGGGEK
ncbi:MAG: CoB--CoM heterodisulfide reductase iron-sulfur subunit A family protein [Candidatus Thorarchaeota archaeon]|nr:MAG: CoB--CoM heterodisulfide reductase iron-sulfur subunit A family protein [Candidatus Thorarchaeota archaeon]